MNKSVKDLTFEDAAALSLSADYKARFIAEYVQTKIRFERLKTTAQKAHIGKLDFKPDTPIDILDKQLGKMYEYLYLLEVRALYENIDLSNSIVDVSGL